VDGGFIRRPGMVARTGWTLPGGGRGRGRPLARLHCRPARRVFHRFRGGRRGRLPAVPGRHTSPPALDPTPPDQWPATGRTMVGGRSLLRLAAARWPACPTEDEWEAAARGRTAFGIPGQWLERGRANADSQRDGFAPTGGGPPRQIVGRGGGLDRQRVGVDGGRRRRRAGPARSRHQGRSLRTRRLRMANRRISRRPPGPAGVGSPTRGSGARAASPLCRSARCHPRASPSCTSIPRTPRAPTSRTGSRRRFITSLGRIERLSVKSRKRRSPLSRGRRMIRRRWDAFSTWRISVSGSVGRPPRGQSPAVTVELLRASDGMHVWGSQYESRDTALQTIPQAVARAVATAITGALRPVERTALARRRRGDPGALRSFPARELRARAADATRRAPRDRPV